MTGPEYWARPAALDSKSLRFTLRGFGDPETI